MLSTAGERNSLNIGRDSESQGQLWLEVNYASSPVELCVQKLLSKSFSGRLSVLSERDDHLGKIIINHHFVNKTILLFHSMSIL